MRSSTSRQKQLRPISPSPPRKTIRTDGGRRTHASVERTTGSGGRSLRGRLHAVGGLGEHARRHRPQVAHDADAREQPQAVVGRVDLPPAEALARRALVAVVVVVPALAAGDERDQQASSGSCRRCRRRRRPNTCASEFTRNVECHSRTVDAKNPTTRPLHPPIRKHATPSAHGPIQSCLLRKRSSGYLAKSLISSYSRRAVLVAEDPADVAPPEAVASASGCRGRCRRTGGGARWCAGPPQRALLRGRRAAERQHELREARQPVAAVREVAVVAGRDEEHPAEVRHERTGRTRGAR